MKKSVRVFNLNDFSEKDQEYLSQNKVGIRKIISAILREAKQAAKPKECYCCGKPTSGFCNSHSIPQFCLKNIGMNGEVSTLNALVNNPLLDADKGINNAGTFHLICRDCDSKLFSEYENPDNYNKQPTQNMLAQIAMKNYLKMISKRLLEIELYNSMARKKAECFAYCYTKNKVNKIDLDEYKEGFIKAKTAIEKNDAQAYELSYYEILDYVVPIAFQSVITMFFDLNGRIINNKYEESKDVKLQDLHICIFPLKDKSIIIIFKAKKDWKYNLFIKEFKRLPLEDRLSVLVFIMFAYSEEIYYSKKIEKDINDSVELIEIGKKGEDIYSNVPLTDPMFEISEGFDLNNRKRLPNLLAEKYKLK